MQENNSLLKVSFADRILYDGLNAVLFVEWQWYKWWYIFILFFCAKIKISSIKNVQMLNLKISLNIWSPYKGLVC